MGDNIRSYGSSRPHPYAEVGFFRAVTVRSGHTTLRCAPPNSRPPDKERWADFSASFNRKRFLEEPRKSASSYASASAEADSHVTSHISKHPLRSSVACRSVVARPGRLVSPRLNCVANAARPADCAHFGGRGVRAAPPRRAHAALMCYTRIDQPAEPGRTSGVRNVMRHAAKTGLTIACACV